MINSFKTNINCASCVARVTAALNEAAGKENWTVDIGSPEKILTVDRSDASPEQIIAAVKKAGFKIEKQ